MIKQRIIFVMILCFSLCGCFQTVHKNVSRLPEKSSIVEKSQSEKQPESSKLADIAEESESEEAKETISQNIKKNKPHNSEESALTPEDAKDVHSTLETDDEIDEIGKIIEAASDSEEDAEDNEADDTEEYSPPAKEVSSLIEEARDFCDIAQKLWEEKKIENALESLDRAYSLILEIDTESKPGLLKEKEDMRLMISKRIIEIHASRHVVVSGNHNAIPLVINKHVQAEIERFSASRENSFFLRSYRRSGKYRDKIVEELKAAGLPEELSWLPLIESGFTANALSRARALGLWQFIPSTGYKFGLKRDRYVDERLDPDKSTQAAIAYLKELHQIFGDWATVLAAYNCGEGRVLRVIREQNVNYLDNFWDLYERLPRETARYVPKFLATLHIVNNLEKYGLDKVKLDSPRKYETVKVSKRVHLKDVAKLINTTQDSLKQLNPELRYDIVPDRGYVLKIPPKKGEVLLASLDNIPLASLASARSSSSSRKKSSRPVYKYHKVRRGETLSKIARRYGTSVKQIARTNKISKYRYITVGKVLKIPYGKGKSSSTAYSGKKSYRTVKHVVRRGEALWNIAKRYGTTTKTIRRLNKLRGTKVRIGQVLKVPGNKKAKRSLRTYRVRRGDAPRSIAKRYNMPLKRFLKVNRLTQKSKIYPGQKLYVD